MNPRSIPWAFILVALLGGCGAATRPPVEVTETWTEQDDTTLPP
jgi:hypothetical protein